MKTADADKLTPYPNRLELLRKARGLTLEELARLVSVSHVSLQRWEKGVRPFSTRWIGPLCKALKCRPAQIFEADGRGIKYVLSGDEQRALDVLTILTPANRAKWFQRALSMLEPELLLKNVPQTDHARLFKSATKIEDDDDTADNLTKLEKHSKKSDTRPS